MDEAIKKILPESEKIGIGKYKYKDFYICLPCGFIKKGDKIHVRFGTGAGRISILKALEGIK